MTVSFDNVVTVIADYELATNKGAVILNASLEDRTILESYLRVKENRKSKLDDTNFPKFFKN